MENVVSTYGDDGVDFIVCDKVEALIAAGDVNTEYLQGRRSPERVRPNMAGGDRLNLVLLGRRGAGKTFAGNTILGRRESSVGPGSSSVCERREGEVCGRPVTVVEMPALCDAHLTASAVSHLFTSLCGHGVHAFLLVTPAAPLTDEDKAEITRIQETFGSRVTDYMMVIFIHENPAAQPDILQQSTDIQELQRICGNRYFVFYNQDILNNPTVPKLLEVIEEMNRATGSCFSLDMYLEAQPERKGQGLEARHKTELEEKDRKIRELEERIKGTSQGDVKTEDLLGRTSPDFDRPYMSELRIVLLGTSGELTSKVGNIILPTEVLLVKDQCESAQGLVNKRPVALINTPDLLDPKLPDRTLFHHIERCVTLSAPGPHAFLLVLENDNITSKEKKRFKRILCSFSPEAFMYSMVLTTQGSKRTRFNQPYTKFLKMCSGRCYQFNNTDEINYTQVTDLIEKIEQMVSQNGGGFLSCEMFKEPESARLGAIQVPLRGAEQKVERKEKPRALSEELQEIKGKKVAGGDRLNLVLFGRRGAEKMFAGNTILGRRESSVDPGSSSVCERRDGEVCGRPVTVVEIPALCDAQLTASTVSHLFTSLCGHGVHAFLLVTPAPPLTDEDRAEITRIRETFGSRVTDYMMVILTHENPAAQPVHDFLQQSTDIQELLTICGNRYFVFYNQDILNNPTVPKLLEVIEEMNRATGSCFSLDMYWEAQLERNGRELEARYKTELEEMDRKIKELEERIKGTSQGAGGKDQSSDSMRIVLVGKTGSGKSATGNTILQREEFQSRISMKSVTTCCKKGEGEVAGRRVAVVDTPGLFDTSFSNEEVQQEIAKCISFLAPGPHVFLLVLQIGRITQEEKDTLQLIKRTFDKAAEMFTIVIFTRGDELRNESIESFIQQGDPVIQNLIKDCGNRFHVFNNNDMSNRTQVSELLDKIDVMVQRNGGGCYTNEMFQEAEFTIRKEYERIMSEKEEEMQREKEKLEEKHEAEMKEMRRRMEEQRHKAEEEIMLQEKNLKDKEEHLKMELEEWKKREKEKEETREREDIKRKARQESEWKSKIGEIEETKRTLEEELKRREEEEKRREELMEEQKRQKREFEARQAEEKKKRNREEQERKNNEARQRLEWEQRIKEAENEKKEVHEYIKKKAKEWEQEREKEQKRKEMDEQDRRQKEEQERREYALKECKMQEEFEKAMEQERQKGENERISKQQLERELEEKQRQLKKQQEQLDKERKEEADRRSKEDAERKEEERKREELLQKQLEKEREELQKSKIDEEARKTKVAKTLKDTEERYNRIISENNRKHEEAARTKAEELNKFKEENGRKLTQLQEDLQRQTDHYENELQEKAKELQKKDAKIHELEKKGKKCLIM